MNPQNSQRTETKYKTSIKDPLQMCGYNLGHPDRMKMKTPMKALLFIVVTIYLPVTNQWGSI